MKLLEGNIGENLHDIGFLLLGKNKVYFMPIAPLNLGIHNFSFTGSQLERSLPWNEFYLQSHLDMIEMMFR